MPKKHRKNKEKADDRPLLRRPDVVLEPRVRSDRDDDPDDYGKRMMNEFAERLMNHHPRR